jgi:predicted acyl esterase
MLCNAKSRSWVLTVGAFAIVAACGTDSKHAANANSQGDASADAGTMMPAMNPAPSEYPAAWDTTFVQGNPLPADYDFGHRITTLAAGTTYGMQTLALPCDISWERDIPVTLRDGTVIYADTLRPTDTTAKLPAIMAWSPYGKALPSAPAMSVPADWFSGLAKFEGPDAAFWVCHGYAIVNVDARGAYKSGGKLQSFGSVDAGDGYDVIEWIAQQDWSNARVGMHGASWLSIAEWFIASTRPPHLKAIAPWNGQSDLYRNGMSLGGIPDTAFTSAVGTMLIAPNGIENTIDMLMRYPLMNDYWADKRPKIENITAAAYVGADIATALHTAGTLDAFRRLGSSEKWLRVNNTNEWHDEYTLANEQDLLRFFDHYLKGTSNDWEKTPHVRVSIMDPGTAGDEKLNAPFDAWPLPDTTYQKLYLSAADAALTSEVPATAGSVSYDAASGQTSFTIHFTKNTQIVGHLMARLYVEAQDADDMDLFLLVEKLDSDGTPLVPSQLAAMYFPAPPPGAPGRQRVSLRGLDNDKSTDFLPVHAFTTPQKLNAGEIVPVDVAIMPTAMRWHAGQQLKLTIAGTYVKGPGLPLPTLNHGTHIVHTGADHASYLQVPVVAWTP